MKLNLKIVLFVACVIVGAAMLHMMPDDTPTITASRFYPAQKCQSYIPSSDQLPVLSSSSKPSTPSMPTMRRGSSVDMFRHKGSTYAAVKTSMQTRTAASSSYAAPLHQTSSAQVVMTSGGGAADSQYSRGTYSGQGKKNASRGIALNASMPTYVVPNISQYNGLTRSSAWSQTGIVPDRRLAPGLGQGDLGSWVEGFVDQPGNGWNYSDGTYEYFDLGRLKDLFDANSTENGTVLIGGVEYTWEDFLEWWNDHTINKYYRTPLPDGVGLLILLACAYILIVYARTRKKRACAYARKTTLLALLLSVGVMVSAQEQPEIDPHFGDTIDRTADDFVIASLLVADPGVATYSVFGHACLRMQCPTYDMDYCFSYESEEVRNGIADFLAGDLKMGLFAIPTEDYCATYREEGRGVYEYTLHLPIEAKRELWRILDEHVAQGINLPYNYYERGCASTCVHFVEQALGAHSIHYDSTLLQNNTTCKARVLAHCDQAPWARFVFGLIAAGEAEKIVSGSDQLCIPADLVEAWQKASIDGHALIDAQPTVLVEGQPQWPDNKITPLIIAIILLLISLLNLSWSKPYFDWLMLALQTALGALMMYLVCYSDLCCTSWNWLIIPFNILPAIAWYWRRYWALPYVGLMVVWCLAMSCIMLWGNKIMDVSHLLLVIAWTLVVFKQCKK